MQNVEETHLHEYAHFLEHRITGLEQELEDLQQLFTMFFELEDSGIKVGYCSCDTDDDEENEEEEGEWF